jgi:hypothetical protein
VRPFARAALASALLVGCGAGEGQGTVDSDNLFVQNCWEGPFHLGPTFFASDPFADTQQIRVQRGDRIVSVSDGVLLIVSDVAKIRTSQLNTDIPLGLPVGVRPPGFPLRVELNPPLVSLTLYLYDTCHLQNGALYSVGGHIRFTSLFSGNRNENNADARLTDATFEAIVTDPRAATLVSGGQDGGAAQQDGGAIGPSSGALLPKYAHESTVTGSFRFFFERGIPAQPFP